MKNIGLAIYLGVMFLLGGFVFYNVVLKSQEDGFPHLANNEIEDLALYYAKNCQPPVDEDVELCNVILNKIDQSNTAEEYYYDR